MRYLFDIHPTFRAIHDYILTFCPVKQYREVEFFDRVRTGIIDVLGDQDLVHFLSGRTGLNGHQRSTQDVGGYLLDVLGALTDSHATLLRSHDLALSTAACMYLGLHHRKIITELDLEILICFFSGPCIVYGDAFLYGYIVLFQ